LEIKAIEKESVFKNIPKIFTTHPKGLQKAMGGRV